MAIRWNAHGSTPSWTHHKLLDSSLPASPSVKTRPCKDRIYSGSVKTHSRKVPVCPMRKIKSDTTLSQTIWSMKMVRPCDTTDSSAVRTGVSKEEDKEDYAVQEKQFASLTRSNVTEASKDGAVKFQDDDEKLKQCASITIDSPSDANEASKDRAVITVEREWSSHKDFVKYRRRLLEDLEDIDLVIVQMKGEYVTEIPKRNDLIVKKNDIISGIKSHMTSCEQQIASLETGSEGSSENARTKVVELRGRLAELAEQKEVAEQEAFDLEEEIYERLEKLITKNIEKERLKCLLAEAELSTLKVENALKKGDHETAMAEYEAFKVRFEKQFPPPSV